MTIIATKRDRTTIFNLPCMSEQEAINHAKKTTKKLTRERFNKRPYGWQYKIK